ncbi:MAG: oligosaccharide flippase family protein [Candidatus Schekmanbacteria bacterium]|nr:oligosaccharide flippase family protein [Candidatus Schekmanbacteria bacterium]
MSDEDRGNRPWSFGPAYLLMAGRAVGFAATFFIPVVLARVFDQTEFGTYRQLFLVFTTLFALAQLGMAESLYYFVPRASAGRRRFASNAVAVLGLSGLCCLAALWAGSEAIAGLFANPRLGPYLPLIGVYLALTLMSAPLEIVLVASGQHWRASAAYALSDVARAALLLSVGLVLGGLRGVLLGAIAHGVLRLVTTLGVVHGVPARDAAPRRGAILGEQLAYTIPFQLAIIVDTLIVNLHQYAVAYQFSAAVFAVYSVGCLQVPLVDFLAQSGGNVLMVGMSKAVHQGDQEAARAIWHDTTRKLAMVFFPVAALLLLTAPDLIVLLFTERYQGSVPIFMIWLALLPLSALQTDAVLRAYAQTRFLLVQNLARLLFVAALLVPLLLGLGLAGAVLVTVLGNAFAKTMTLWHLRQMLGVPASRVLPWRDLGRLALACALLAVPALAVRALLGGGPALSLVATAVTFVGCALPVLSWMSLLDRELVTRVTSLARRFASACGRGRGRPRRGAALHPGTPAPPAEKRKGDSRCVAS